MGLTQCREHLISRTFEAIQGVPRGIVHLYSAASELHKNRVFSISDADCLKMVVDSIAQTRDLADAMTGSDIRLEFSPEEFTDSSLTFVLELCEAVFETWGKATGKHKSFRITY